MTRSVPQFFCILLALLLFLGAKAPGSVAGEKITVAYSDFPPLTGKIDVGGRERPGLLIEMYQNVLSEMGYEVRALKLPPKRIGALMSRGQEIDLYICGEFSRGQRPAYSFGPKFISLTAVLIQLASEPPLGSVALLKNRAVLKQQGFGGLTNLIDPSNTFQEAKFTSIVPMLRRERSSYVVDYKERIIPRLLEKFGRDEFRVYELKRYKGYLCLNGRFDRVEERLQKIHDGMIAFQNSEKGKSLFAEYRYGGKFGSLP